MTDIAKVFTTNQTFLYFRRNLNMFIKKKLKNFTRPKQNSPDLSGVSGEFLIVCIEIRNVDLVWHSVEKKTCNHNQFDTCCYVMVWLILSNYPVRHQSIDKHQGVILCEYWKVDVNKDIGIPIMSCLGVRELYLYTLFISDILSFR